METESDGNWVLFNDPTELIKAEKFQPDKLEVKHNRTFCRAEIERSHFHANSWKIARHFFFAGMFITRLIS